MPTANPAGRTPGSRRSPLELSGAHANTQVLLIQIAGELARDVLEVGSVPAFGHLAINKSAASVDLEANLPPRRGYTHKLLPVGSADIQICFYDVVSLEAHSVDKNMFIGQGRIDLSPEHFKPFRSAGVSDRFEFMKAGVRGHGAINSRQVRREERLRETQEVLQELRLCGICLQNGPDFADIVPSPLSPWKAVRLG
jgi:hypothetical protein